MAELRGITWDHPRGMAPMLATAAAYEQAHPGTRITWTARSLQAFGDQPLEELASRFDLLVIDHPFAGVAARAGCLLPLDEHLPAAFLEEQARQSVGPSHRSYQYAGHQWAVAIDAAAQVSAYRSDLLADLEVAVPRTWGEVLDLAGRRQGPRVALPLSPVNAFCSFLSLCANHGEPPGAMAERLVGRATGAAALNLLVQLAREGHPDALDLDPTGMLDRMAGTDEIAYAPLLFGYSNYSRPGFAPHLCCFTTIPGPDQQRAGQGAILGGTGLAISAACRAVVEASDYLRWVASAECQRTLYVQSGGQPANRLAWTDPVVNAATSNFFLDTLETLDRCYLRPRYDGFITFQDHAGPAIHEHLRRGGDAHMLLDHLDTLYVASHHGT